MAYKCRLRSRCLRGSHAVVSEGTERELVAGCNLRCGRGWNCNGIVVDFCPATTTSPNHYMTTTFGLLSVSRPITLGGAVSSLQGLWRSKLRQARYGANLRGQPERLEEPQKNCAVRPFYLNHHHLLRLEQVGIDHGYTVISSWTNDYNLTNARIWTSQATIVR